MFDFCFVILTFVANNKGMNIKEKAGDFLLDIAKLVFGGVILAGIMAESLNKVWLYSVGVVIFIVCLVFAFMLYKIAKENKKEE